MRWSFDPVHGVHAGEFPVMPVDRPLSGLADVLEPESCAHAIPVVSSHEWAFADTVSLHLLPADEPAPLSRPIIVHDPLGVTAEQQLLPRAFPPPAAAAPLAARARDALQASIDEARELWAGTAEMVNARPGAITLFRRARAMWSFWEWGHTDILRAAMIGVAVFLAAACVGASVFGAGTAQASSREARAARTADDHTPTRVVVRAKHTRR